MLRKENTFDIISLNIARTRIPKKKALFIVSDMSDMSDIQGYISCISDGTDSYDALIEEYNRIKEQKKQAIIIGSYENGGAIGVQYEV